MAVASAVTVRVATAAVMLARAARRVVPLVDSSPSCKHSPYALAIRSRLDFVGAFQQSRRQSAN